MAICDGQVSADTLRYYETLGLLSSAPQEARGGSGVTVLKRSFAKQGKRLG